MSSPGIAQYINASIFFLQCIFGGKVVFWYLVFGIFIWYLYLHAKYIGFSPLKLLIKGSSFLIITFRVFDRRYVGHFIVSQNRCAKEIDLWVRTIPGNTSSFLGGRNKRVGNVENALTAKCIKVGRERMNAEGQMATKIQSMRYISLTEIWERTSKI